MFFDLPDPGPSALLLTVSGLRARNADLIWQWDQTARVAFPSQPTQATQEDKVESFCVCCACERCMDFWLSTSLKCFSTCKEKIKFELYTVTQCGSSIRRLVYTHTSLTKSIHFQPIVNCRQKHLINTTQMLHSLVWASPDRTIPNTKDSSASLDTYYFAYMT